jgi:hypothetical protein
MNFNQTFELATKGPAAHSAANRNQRGGSGQQDSRARRRSEVKNGSVRGMIVSGIIWQSPLPIPLTIIPTTVPDNGFSHIVAI